MKITFDFTPHEMNELSTVFEEVAQTLRFRADLIESVGDTINQRLREQPGDADRQSGVPQ